MTKITYDLSLLVGTVLIGAGVWMRFGAAVALVTVGAMVIALTLFGALVVAGKR